MRESAYRLWEEDGRPEGRADGYCHRARERHIGERLWQFEGCPDGRAEECWRPTLWFERD